MDSESYLDIHPESPYIINKLITIGVIMDKYTELYAWIWKAFGKGRFSIDQFRSTFPTSQGPKVAHDMVKKGYLKRAGRGVYEAIEPSKFIEKIGENEVDFTILNGAGKDYAFCDSTAVSIWTDGYYWTGFTQGFRPINVTINKRDKASWRNFFKRKGVRYAFESETRTLYGQVFVLHPRERLKYVEKDGFKVILLKETVDFCLKHELVYEPALEYLDEKYGIGYKRRERMIA